jgi:ATP-dependent helicase IRC3
LQNRPYQDQCHQAIKTEYLKGTNRQLISMATGTGKTVVFSQLPDRVKDILPGQTLILAHREELIDQAIDKMRAINPTLRIDKEMAEHRADPSTADAIVASVATLGRKGTKRIQKYNWERIDKYITDEAHHSVASSYLNIYDAAGLLAPGDKRLLLGVTATPQRGDGKALAQIYQKISFVYSMRQAIEDGWLVDVRGIRVSTDTTLDSVHTVAGDFAQDELADVVNNPARNQLIVKAWLDKGEQRQTVGFTVDIQHAKDLAEMFRHYSVKAEAVWGNDPERAQKLERHRSGDITVLLNCGVLTEGYDDWRIGCVLLARPTKSGALYVQMVGRGTRLQDRTGNLKDIPFNDLVEQGIKKDCIVIDVVDASSRHSLVTLPTLMGMSAKLDLQGGSLVKAIRDLEQAQKQYPKIDFSKLTDINNLATHVESVNLFEVKFPPEVEEHSELSWHPSPDSGFVLLLPNQDQVKIKQNLLDKWEISAKIHNQKYKGERDSIEQAFSAADNLVNQYAVESLKLLKREATWHNDSATVAQLNLLRKFYKGKPLPDDLTKGKASQLISAFLAGKA